ncbi:MAG TPA: acetyl/propionyl-CoA carboxylase subunit alpha, partial [Planctomycetes bacterium]|nr:acetyl/propionyl-CoA carboxylase subunit alpha [Planctomycetota bacterium]
ADKHGNVIYLGERECSIQRRHQKVIEEAPSPFLDEATRKAMGEQAVALAQAVDYTSAGTVEFIVDGARNFYFLEMNTRLQVEHPVTELVLGVDLVRMQLEIAAGGDLGVTAGDLAPRGHAIEVRINAEDPTNGFVPSTGTIGNLRWPGGPWVRIDSGLYRGMEVGLDYDPMLAKVIVWAPNRTEAIARMKRALEELNIGGVRTGAPAALAVLEDERFVDGRFDTHLIESVDLSGGGGERAQAAAVAAVLHRWTEAKRRSLTGRATDRGEWLARDRRSASPWCANTTTCSPGGMP